MKQNRRSFQCFQSYIRALLKFLIYCWTRFLARSCSLKYRNVLFYDLLLLLMFCRSVLQTFMALIFTTPLTIVKLNRQIFYKEVEDTLKTVWKWNNASNILDQWLITFDSWRHKNQKEHNCVTHLTVFSHYCTGFDDACGPKDGRNHQFEKIILQWVSGI